MVLKTQAILLAIATHLGRVALTDGSRCFGKRDWKGTLLASVSDRGGLWRRCARRLGVLCGAMASILAYGPTSTETAIANGDTRTLTFVNNHLNESGSFTYKVDGYYDQAVLDKLNWIMRDWRLNEQTKMDPKLFDIIWEVNRQAGSQQPIDVLSGYRSPQTNAMLRRRSRLVAEHSQHMQGKAVDAHFTDVGTATIRDVAMRMQEGGVGFYPIGSTPWVHIDSGEVRYWPRMSHDSLARLFPDGKTVFIPADGQPMSGYEEARAMIQSRGGEVVVATRSGNFFSWLFGGARGGGADDDEETGGASVIASGRGGTRVASSGRGGAGAQTVNVASAADSAPVSNNSFLNGRGSLPSGPTYLEPAPVAAKAPEPVPAKQVEVATAVQTDAAPDVDTTGVQLHGPVAAEFIAPLPPRKPDQLKNNDLLASVDVDTPLPRPRPSEFAVASTMSKSVPSPDLVAALIERDGLPNEITHGVGAAPRSALALVDPKPAVASDNHADALARASALTMPPLPPPRPHAVSEGVSTAEKSVATSAPIPPQRPNRRPSAANPYGDLVVDAFNAPPPPPATSLADGLRGTSP